jgi:hypothetical protein
MMDLQAGSVKEEKSWKEPGYWMIAESSPFLFYAANLPEGRTGSAPLKADC